MNRDALLHQVKPSLFAIILLGLCGCSAGAQTSAATRSPRENPPSPTAVRASAPETQVDPQSLPGIAVMPFDATSVGRDPWDVEGVRVGLQQMLITELAQNSNLRLVERGRLREIIQELDLGQSGQVSPETAAEVGKLVGARYMVVGGYFDADGDVRIDARTVDVETGVVLGETATKVEGRRGNLLGLVVELGVKIVDAAELPPLPTQVVDQRRSITFPQEAITLYNNALVQVDNGNVDGAKELLRRLVADFPEYDAPRQELIQLESGAPKEIQSCV